MFVLHLFFVNIPAAVVVDVLTLLTNGKSAVKDVLSRSCSQRELREDSAMSRSRLALTGTRPAMINTLRMFKSRILQCLLSPGHVIWQARKQPKTRAAALNGRRGTGVTALRLNTHSATDQGARWRSRQTSRRYTRRLGN
jgi:hypothetical protein